MSKEQANTYKKFRTANDAQGNLAWAARIQQKAMRASPEAPANVETEFELSTEERILWRLLKIPRKYMDLEHTNLLTVDATRAFFRGMISADIVDILEAQEAKALLPIEVDRLRKLLTGQVEAPKARQPLKARVYRPNIDDPEAAEPEPEPPPAPDPAPAPRPISMPNAKAPGATPGMSTPPTSGLNAEERALRDELEKLHAQVGSMNHYAFLGVAQNADDAAIKSAFLKKAKELHPDRIAGMALGRDASMVAKVDQLFKRLQEANRTLSHKDERVVYDQKLAAGIATNSSGKKVRRPEEAHVMFTKAEHLLRKKEYKQAEMHFRAAVELDWEDPKIGTGLAWCIWSNEDAKKEERLSEAKKRLDEIVKKFKYGDAAYKLGLIHRALGDEVLAQKKFGDAMKFDPAHLDAQREVRLFEKRASGDKGDGGLLGKFFKK